MVKAECPARGSQRLPWRPAGKHISAFAASRPAIIKMCIEEDEKEYISNLRTFLSIT